MALAHTDGRMAGTAGRSRASSSLQRWAGRAAARRTSVVVVERKWELGSGRPRLLERAEALANLEKIRERCIVIIYM